MAATGHAGTHAPQSMHSSGWMYSIVASANSASSLRGWMQSTGHTSTQAVSLVSMHGSVMTNGMIACLRLSLVRDARLPDGLNRSDFWRPEPGDYTLTIGKNIIGAGDST